jgi:hypothetical protein
MLSAEYFRTTARAVRLCINGFRGLEAAGNRGAH